ncbi:MAG: thymidine phosphorylase family protein [Proteobacteria bacterium]|nr:thymidine phosphorylase family protein [Pseudomonadota bacterium]
MTARLPAHGHEMTARRLGVFAQDEALVFMRRDCAICRSEGLAPRTRVLLKTGSSEAIATLIQVDDHIVEQEEAGLSEAAWTQLKAKEGETLSVRHAPDLAFAGALRRRIFGHRLATADFSGLIGEVAAGRLSEIQLAAFLTACSTLPLDDHETLGLTRAMVEVGERLSWPQALVLDKHSIGGLPGNRTTPIVVAIVAAHGLTIPKTSSRAITSPAGTADTMETLTRVDLSLDEIRKVVEHEHGCLAWGGAVNLSPADDVLIRVERALDIDPEGQLIASVLSKKIAAGATHAVIDMPVGRTAKVRDEETAARLMDRLARIARTLGLEAHVVVSDGSQPVGRGIGPALEARDVLAVLQNQADAPADLREKAVMLAAALLELGGAAPQGAGPVLAEAAIADGRAWRKFQAICEAQGGLREPPHASHHKPLLAGAAGMVADIDNRRLGRLAKLAGAPDAKAAGVEMHVRLGDQVGARQPLLTVHAESAGELDYAMAYAAANPDLIAVRAA